jgi:hypothetical protein
LLAMKPAIKPSMIQLTMLMARLPLAYVVGERIGAPNPPRSLDPLVRELSHASPSRRFLQPCESRSLESKGGSLAPVKDTLNAIDPLAASRRQIDGFEPLVNRPHTLIEPAGAGGGI